MKTKEITETFNTLSSNVGPNLAKKINKPKNKSAKMPDWNNPYTRMKSLIQKFVKLKDRAGRMDGIRAKVLEIIANYKTLPLVYIFNLSIDKFIWLDSFKIAEVVPINKNGNKNLTTNYRPISLISNIAEIYEKLIPNRLTDFINKHQILSNKQYGFRRNRSTNDAIADLKNHIHNNMDKKIPKIDMAKAFDTVSHKILIKKLERRSQVLDLLKSHLTIRKQIVKTFNIKSCQANINTGVLQGTMLGPLLFLLYVS